MIVVVVFLSVTLAAGLVGSFAARRWPTADPTSPRFAARLARWELRKHPRWVQSRLDPGPATGLALTVAVGVVVLGGLVFAAVAVMVAAATGFQLADHPIERWVNEHTTSFATDLLRAVTDLGDTWPILILVVLVAVVESVRVHSRAIVPFLVAVLVGQSLVVWALKAIIDRARPAINPVAEHLGPSFPSGHTASAAACMAALALLLGRRRSRSMQIALTGIAVGAGVAVAATRVLLGVHFLTDVIAGLAVGWAWFALCAIAFGGRLLIFGAPSEIAERADALQRSGKREP